MGQMFMYDLYQVRKDYWKCDTCKVICQQGLHCMINFAFLFILLSTQSRNNSEDFTLFTLDDVDSAFDKIQQLKYSQIVNLKGELVERERVTLHYPALTPKCFILFLYLTLGKGHGLSITPLPAGHMIGGTIWKIVKDGEEEIVYAVDFNHKREM